MVLGFFCHVLAYFTPTISLPPDQQSSNLTANFPPFDLATAIPVIDPQTGEITAYVSRQLTSVTTAPQVVDNLVNSKMAQPASMSSGNTVYTRNADGHFVPVLSWEKPTSIKSQSHVKHAHDSSNTKHSRQIQGANGEDWDGWPDGPFVRDFTWGEWEATGHLQVHWATKMGGGYRGDVNAAHWAQGKKMTRQCQVLTRPNTTMATHTQQLECTCQCGADREYYTCPVQSEITKWSGGVHYENGGVHNHTRLTHVLSLLPKEQDEFQAVVENHPEAGPLKMIVGVPGLKGPGKSVADISPVLLNADRVSKEKQRVKQGVSLQGGDNFISTFARFDREHPGFVIHSTLGDVTVISCQSPFMSSQLVKYETLKGPLNGMVSDAAHGWWLERTSLLIVSSTYCPNLFCWVPGIFSYSNGASTQHYKLHFYALLESIAAEAGSHGISIIDLLFLGVMDFSEAEREGFILAFIEFWQQRNDPRSAEELRKAAEELLRGCQEHFAANVTRLKRLSGVVSPPLANDFQAQTLALLDLEDAGQFAIEASNIIRDFPNTKSWFEWWMWPSHAKMLFISQCVMDPFIWDSIPSTTNAEESMHWKLYSATGCNHSLLEGFYSLVAVANYYERCFQAANVGTPHRYGRPEPWKLTKATIGRTKKSRTPRFPGKRKKNDGRPPDTAKELLLNMKKTKAPTPRQSTCSKTPPGMKAELLKPEKPKKKPPPRALIQLGPPSYPWNANSCWLDTSLELLFICSMRNFNEFSFVFNLLIDFDVDDQSMSQILREHQDTFRDLLRNQKVVKDVVSPGPLMAWLYHIIRAQEPHPGSFQAVSYFYALVFDLHNCTGSSKIGGSHLEIVQPRRFQELHARRNLHKTYGGSIANYFQDFISIDKRPEYASCCWCSKDGIPLCPGDRVNLKDLVISIPVILTIELELEKQSMVWDFPETLYLLGDPEAVDHGIIYDLLGLALLSPSINHFIARYVSADRKIIYTYDGLSHKGIPIIEPKATFKSHVAGKKISVPTGYHVYQAFYHLRGGVKAQSKFHEIRTEALKEIFDVQITQSDPNTLLVITSQSTALVRLDHDLCRAWTSYDNTYEYISRELKEKNTVGPHISPNHSDVPESPASSLPDSEFSVNCQCGLSGDGNILYHQEDGEAIQCDSCRDWSHIVCQYNGRANNLGRNEPFMCDFCDLSNLFQHAKTPSRSSKHKEMEARTLWNKPLGERLRHGRGALARLGEFWYPVRVIHHENDGQWKVCWWRASDFLTPGIIPNTVTTVDGGDITDSLWNDRTGWRKIRLGKWIHSWDIPTSEDILADPSSIPYNDAINDALMPSESILRRLLDAPDTVRLKEVPAKAWLERSTKKKKDPSKELVPYVGTLSLTARAQISNWFDVKIGKDKKIRHLWLGRLPIAHAYTIYIAQTLKGNPKNKKLTESELLEKAWKAQFSGMPSVLMDVDVDKDCLYMLEEEMFEKSARAGIAGHYQWGLDAGDHDGWNPYKDVPQHFDHGDREGSETELEVTLALPSEAIN